MINKNEVLELFNKYNVEGYVNYWESSSTSLDYETFMDEVSINVLNKSGTSVVVIKDNRKASASFDGFSMEDLENAIKDITGFADISEQDKDIELANVTDTVEADFSNEELKNVDLAFIKKEFEKVKDYKFKDYIKFEEFSYSYKEAKIVFINSLGAYKTEKSNAISTYLSVSWELNNRKEEDYIYASRKELYSYTDERIQKLESNITDKLNATKPDFETGEYVVALKNTVAGTFLSMILGHFNAEWIREWFSMFTNAKIWDKLFSDKLTVVTDPTLKTRTASSLYDGEGVNLEKTTLIENGVWKAKFVDYKNHKKDPTTKLWNSTPTNIIVEGDKTPEYLKEAQFLFTNLMAYHTIDSNTWKFALNGEGYVIRNGEKCEYVKNVSLSGNVKDIFTNIVAIWDNDNKDGWNACPSITFKGWTIIV